MAAVLEHKPSMAASMSASVVTQETTFHSFYDVDIYETPAPPQKQKVPEPVVRNVSTRSTATVTARRQSHDRPTTASQIKRQDSGYGSSSVSSPRPSTSYSRPAPPRRASTTNAKTSKTSSLSVLRNRTRPSTRRSNKSYQLHNQNNTTSSLFLVRPNTQQNTQPQTTSTSHNTFFHFPTPNPMAALAPPPREPTPAPSIPPQAQHYWTSDRTRRLEYAAIDAASRGVKGWIKRNLVPDCFVGEDRHVAFDDDSGSVRRYRLELEEEPQDEKTSSCHRGWHFWRSKSHQHQHRY